MTVPLLAAAHGTRSVAGLATIRALIDQVRRARPDLDVDLCFLDVLRPRLAERLDATPGPAVVVPVLLSAGYHVLDDIPATAAPRARIARHLGPHPSITQVLAERLASAGGDAADVVALVASPSTRASAEHDRARAATDLAAALGRPVHALTVGDSLAASLARLPGRVAVATYLISEGHFHDALREATATAGIAAVAEPLGAHPAIAALIAQRYDDAADLAR